MTKMAGNELAKKIIEEHKGVNQRIIQNPFKNPKRSTQQKQPTIKDL